MEYTAAEYVDMLIMYGQCGENAVRAAREYNIRFPERRPIAYGVILRLLYRARETANLIPNRRINAVMERRARTVQNEEQILHMVDNAPEMSVREISRELAISRSTVHRVLSDERFHPYHYTRVQHLLPNDYGARLRFCTWLINCENDRPGFARNILFTDESNFTRDGVYNSRNTHLWADENPKEYKIRSFQHRFSVNLWAGVLDNVIVSTLFLFIFYLSSFSFSCSLFSFFQIGPFEMPVRMTGQLYAQFLRNSMPALLEDVPLEQRRQMFFQQDGAPSHASRMASATLTEKFPDRWVGCGGPVHWRVRSPDLTPLDSFLWSFIKNYVYRERVNSREET